MNNFFLPALTLVTGGAASGKSRFAEKLITDSELPRVYIATAQAWDDEMREKISQHRDRRDGWRDVEAPLDVVSALATVGHGEAALLDCLTMWLTNHLLAESDLGRETRRLCDALTKCAGHVVVVTNEVGQGIVPDNALSRQFREAQGRLNQHVAAQAQAVTVVMSGLPLTLKAPV
ncbi:bifunctional adenosylcobinamide kinase/adenosylcobinamide-phosphate guanylyltransferase [Meridianimarinicoccus aquatilis]|uniref:Bifunctional adenosylcobalamin biosynthesis protein n=1 Tax=Meridianimarinicoccus aquatilis TaxID=2552766 RepID=A0A4R6B5I3_9RHOB|nr:bifunctional adenosylcobinamide kinase/adenosylcobinamide-phosphate guanylyltransferase [Fluviibacterium aquatile]QIE41427.1 bifunctional adenosylcobinamide kinase/adenosylcobinamide-phosphate guanylyltransferase [Rhodobacteraceae bacterium SC52]TDL91438.1 bifunctional adenosylcobinamide kinase/adenosylcobinamide-phosphate guanylyltransferase [Fluviibacterium aquatile]